ncbi:MAG: GPR endopeptidase [Clostridia bacterium]|nr:GPR endopeptidase [Clostridia bacterium]MDD4376318.1 GPR endopeptidase [Clostridia bacterium]
MNKSYLNFRTDMADERVDTYKQVHNLSEIDGIKVASKDKDGINTTIVDVINENGKKVLGKEIGKYITIEKHDMEYLDEEQKQLVIKEVGDNINLLLNGISKVNIENKRKANNKSVLVVGLGNSSVTPDALGPKVISYINITRHIIKYADNLIEADTREVSGISPGVLGTTGIETSEIIASVVDKIKPEMLIVVDSLASKSVSRIGKTIQLSNTGITPGAGVHNKRSALDEKTLGIPVIAVGVPTVVDMATITNEAIDKLIDSIKNEVSYYTNGNMSKEKINGIFELFEKDERYNMITNALDSENYIVTPKEIDNVIAKISEIIASSINVALT